MDSAAKIVADLGSVYWWFSVVIVGLVINVISSYLRAPLDRAYEKYTHRTQERKKQNNIKLWEAGAEISKDPVLVAIEVANEMRLRIFSLCFLLFCFGSLVLAAFQPFKQQNASLSNIVYFVALASALVCYTLCLFFWHHSEKHMRVLFAARKLTEKGANPSFQRTASGGR